MDIKAGRLSGEYLGEREYPYKIHLVALNVHHEYVSRRPVATFHGPVMIKFHWGVEWNVQDLADLITLHAQWVKEIEALPG